ncbi:hypothetical protein [Flavobacterium sp.]|uniref:hypothetical protein n=1 Tax=Flavobacterium sp. TaxID=239 RepID=UPI0026333ED5|nr:hypothetical protein [Flavobacterium sp.]
MKRFQDENKRAHHFANEFQVKCPKCGTKATIKRTFSEKDQYERYPIRILKCPGCHLYQEDTMIKYKATVNQYCCNNVEKVKYESQLLNEKPQKIKVKCTSCNQIKEFVPRIEEVHMCFKTDENNVREWRFNTELWYQKTVRGNVFWAYNEAHIDYLEGYIAAGLRERNSQYNVGKTMVASLPKFVKDARNRDKLLKVIKEWKKSYK